MNDLAPISRSDYSRSKSLRIVPIQDCTGTDRRENWRTESMSKTHIVYWILLVCPVTLLLLMFRSYRPPKLPFIMHIDVQCSSVLDNMMTGSWRTRNLTQQEQTEINNFLKNGLFFVDPRRGFQKPDLGCGNITYYPWMSRDQASQWFRVLCDPQGVTPCCYNNRCESRTVQECQCPQCYDLRPLVHAEYSNWVPGNKRCLVKNYTSTSACDLLQGGTLHFYGDSLVRQMFLALVIILKGDYQTGGLRPDAPQAIKSMCKGMYVFPTKNCRSYLDYKPKVCGGKVNLEFHHSAKYQEATVMLNAAKTLKGRNKTIILVGCGSWTHFNIFDTVTYAFSLLTTLFPLNETQQWPKVVWSNFHSLGLWRNPLLPTVTNQYTKLFNQYMERVLSLYNIPVFDAANITKGVRSIDGLHYGPGINFLKAQIYLNYIAELQQKKVWV